VELKPSIAWFIEGSFRFPAADISLNSFRAYTETRASSADAFAQRGSSPKNYRGTKQRLKFVVTGAEAGAVYGSTLYSDESNFEAAAVHAGVVAVGQPTVVLVEILPGQDAAGAEMVDGSMSTWYGRWSGSYRFLPSAEAGAQREGMIQVRVGSSVVHMHMQ